MEIPEEAPGGYGWERNTLVSIYSPLCSVILISISLMVSGHNLLQNPANSRDTFYIQPSWWRASEREEETHQHNRNLRERSVNNRHSIKCYTWGPNIPHTHHIELTPQKWLGAYTNPVFLRTQFNKHGCGCTKIYMYSDLEFNILQVALWHSQHWYHKAKQIQTCPIVAQPALMPLGKLLH